MRLGKAIFVAAILLGGCEVTKTVYVSPPDTTPPAVPRGVSSITGDRQVEIVWYANTEPDLAGYGVYRSDSANGLFTRIAVVHFAPNDPNPHYIDRNVGNGRTYYYAVTAIDLDGNESELSSENVFDTPRPAGYDVRLDTDVPAIAGFDFYDGIRVPLGDTRADIEIVYDRTLGTLIVQVPDLQTDIQDFGYTKTLDVVDWAPEKGWSSLGWAELIPGHSYVVWTRDDNYAKFRVNSIDSHALLIDWACQLVPGNPELKRAADTTASRSGR